MKSDVRKIYKRPVAVLNAATSEGIYLASGDGCYTADAYIHQTPQTGRGDFRLQVNGHHHADHTREAQVLTITFNQPVTYSYCNGNGAYLIGGNGTNTLVVGLTYHQNPTDEIGIGDFVVNSDAGLAVTDISITD